VDTEIPVVENETIERGLVAVSRHDMYYGSGVDTFLGLAADGDDSSLRPNYDEPVGSVLLRYAKHFVKTGDGMKLLYQTAGMSNKEIPIPSWVPDWTQSHRLDTISITMTARTGLVYKAAADTSPRIRLADDEDEIVVSGGYVDRVSRTAVEYVGDPDSDWLVKVRNFSKEAGSFILNRESYMTGESLFDVQWKTLVRNSSAETTLAAPEEYGQQYRDCGQMIEDMTLDGPLPGLDNTNSYFKRLFPIMTQYKLCEARTGLVGMVPLDTMVGDLIYIFTGGTMPFILRPSAGLQSKYKVVGGCYIHGIMDGEAVRSDKWREEEVTLY
jgi:hypothetical protein